MSTPTIGMWCSPACAKPRRNGLRAWHRKPSLRSTLSTFQERPSHSPKAASSKTRVQYAGARVGPPYLVLVVVGEHNPRDGFAALRGYAQPIARPSSFIVVHNQAERDAVIGLLDLQYRWRRRQIDIGFKRPLFDLTTRAGPLRPDLVLDIRDNSTGELIEAALEVIANDEPDYIDAKQRKISALAELGPTVFARAATLRDHGIEAILKANLGIG